MLAGAARSRCAGVCVWMWAPPPFPHKGIGAQSVPSSGAVAAPLAVQPSARYNPGTFGWRSVEGGG